jgi:hypothetical protein
VKVPLDAITDRLRESEELSKHAMALKIPP